MQIAPYVSETPGLNGGYPVVAGTRTPIWILHDYYVLYERDMAQMLEHFPHLTAAQILGALDYYARCPERVDEDRARNRETWEKHSGLPWPD